jgi:multiple sugar transport system permease protein
MASTNIKWVFLAPALVIIAAVGIYPLIYAIWSSLSILDPSSLSFVGFAGLENYSSVLSNWRFWNTLKITILFVLICVPIELLIGLTVALAFDVDSPKLGNLRAAFIIPTMVAPVAVAILWRLMYQPQIGIINFLLGKLGIGEVLWLADPTIALLSVAIVDIWQWTPFMFLIILAGLRSLPTEILDAGRVDGAAYFQSLFFLKLPLLKNVILIATLIRFLDAIRTFDTVYVLTYGGPASSTDLYSMLTFREAFKFFHIESASALSIIFLILLAIIVPILFIKIFRLRIDLA